MSAISFELLQYITDPEERAFVLALAAMDKARWHPDEGNVPQCLAFASEADITGYGGAAGGGKTELGLGLALEKHTTSLVLRPEGTQLIAINDRLTEIFGSRDNYSGRDKIWRFDNKQIELGALTNPGDELGYQGRPHDFVFIDEAANFREAQVRFVLGWLRTTIKGQRCRAVLAFNPQTSAEGRWIIAFFAPWLDDKHPNPAKPGELRYFATIAGKDVEVANGQRFIIVAGKPCYDFDPRDHDPTKIIKPKSRTFIPSRVTDNRYLMETGYMAELQALPEPLRSQMLYGDFKAGMHDDAFQVIPTAWVDAAMKRWTKPARLPEMMSLGIDVARGGADNTIIARRHIGMWFDEPLVYPGTETPDGHMVAALTMAATRDSSPQHIDVIGVGASPYDILNQAKQNVVGVDVRMTSLSRDKSGRLAFYNLRSELWWKMRELLDPANNSGIALPPDTRLRADLCAPKWMTKGVEIYVQSTDEIKAKIGRSPDYATAYILAAIETPKLAHLPGTVNRQRKEYDPYENV